MEIKISIDGNPCLEFSDLNKAINASSFVQNLDFILDDYQNSMEKYQMLERQYAALKKHSELIESQNEHYLALLKSGFAA